MLSTHFFDPLWLSRGPYPYPFNAHPRVIESILAYAFGGNRADVPVRT